MTEELEILVKIGNRFYEGKLRPQRVGQHIQVPDKASVPPVFPEPYSEMLIIIDQGDSWEIKPRHFLDSGDFVEIVRIVKQYQGEYVSAGKSSHFRVPKA